MQCLNRPALAGGARDTLESTTSVLVPKLPWEWHALGGAEDGVWAEAEEERGVSSKGWFSGANATPEEAFGGEEGGGMCEVEETASAGVLGAAGSAGGLRPEGGRLAESSLEVLAPGLLLFLRFSLTPWLRLVCS